MFGTVVVPSSEAVILAKEYERARVLLALALRALVMPARCRAKHDGIYAAAPLAYIHRETVTKLFTSFRRC